MRFVPANAQHIGTRQNQQDSFGFSDLADERFQRHGGFVAIVADGMGGLAHGDAASRQAVKTFLEAYATKQEAESIPAALERSLRAANQAVYDLAVEAGAPGDVGTTLIAVAMKPEGLYWISVGDSAIYLFRGGVLNLLTTGHVYARVLDAKASRGEISDEQARLDPQREALTSYVGSPEVNEIDRNLRPFPVQAGDVVVLASDGLFKTLTDGEITEVLAAEGERASEVLVRKTIEYQKRYQDNVTVCQVRVDESQGSAPTPAPIEVATAATTVRLPEREPVPPPKKSNKGVIAVAVGVLLVALAGLLVWKMLLQPQPPAGTAPVQAAPPQGVAPGGADAEPPPVVPVPSEPQAPKEVPAEIPAKKSSARKLPEAKAKADAKPPAQGKVDEAPIRPPAKDK